MSNTVLIVANKNTGKKVQRMEVGRVYEVSKFNANILVESKKAEYAPKGAKKGDIIKETEKSK